MHIYSYMHAYIRMYVQMRMPAYVRAYIHAYMHTGMNACKHIYQHKNTYGACTCFGGQDTYTYTHMHLSLCVYIDAHVLYACVDCKRHYPIMTAHCIILPCMILQHIRPLNIYGFFSSRFATLHLRY